MTTWLSLSRWRALRDRKEGWVVESERGTRAASGPYEAHADAQEEADRLNRDEQRRIAGWA